MKSTKSPTPSRQRTGSSVSHASEASRSAREHYHREKARRATKNASENELMAAARREYEALLASDAAKGKGGRPKKKPAQPSVAHEESADEEREEDEAADG